MKHLGLSLAVATCSAIGLTGCGGSSGGGSQVNTLENETGVTVNGTASKGIVINGMAKAFAFGPDGGPTTTPIAMAATNASGGYALSIPAQHNGKAIYIVVDDNGGNATIKCDISPGCDLDGDGVEDAAFGAELELAEGDLSMSAVVPDTAASALANVTPLTTVSAALAVDIIASGAVTDFNIQEAVNNANSQVADRFGLMGDVTKIPVVDLTDPEQVAGIIGDAADTVQYAAINAAIISAVQSDLPNTTIDQAIAQFANDFATNGLSDNAVSGAITDLGDILADAKNVLDEVTVDIIALGEDFAAAVDELNDLDAELTNEQATADAATQSDTGDQGTASPTANAENLAQVKAFVEELRELGTAIDSSIVDGAGSADTVATILDNFDLQVDAANMASSADANAAMEGVALAMQAMAEVYETNFLAGEAPIDPVAGTYQSSDGLTVEITVSQGIATLMVTDATLSVEVDGALVEVDVDVNATVDELTINDDVVFSGNSQGSTEQGTLSGSVDFSIAGTATSGTIDLQVVNGTVTTAMSATVDSVYSQTESGYSDSIDESISAANFLFDLNVALAHNATIETVNPELDAMSFSGGLTFAFSNWAFDEVAQYSADFSEGFSSSEYEEFTFSPGVINLGLSGTFANSTESFDMAFLLDADGSSIPAWTEVFDVDGSYTLIGGEETNSEFVNASASLSFNAQLSGIADAIDFEFDISRQGRDDGEVSVSLSYPGRSIVIAAEGSNVDTTGNGLASMTLTNNDGIVITITGDESIVNEEDEISLAIRKDTDGDGDVDANDFLYAWYEVRSGIELLVFADDNDADNIEFQSLF